MNEAIEKRWIKVKKLKQYKISDLNLGKGEREAINLRFEFDNASLLIDEKKGRFIAKTFDIPVLGTLGILLLSK